MYIVSYFLSQQIIFSFLNKNSYKPYSLNGTSIDIWFVNFVSKLYLLLFVATMDSIYYVFAGNIN